MSKITEAARGQPCMVRIPGVCNGNPETVVLAHYRLAGTCGTGMKPPDILGAWCCSSCHDVCDGRAQSDDWDYDEVRLMHAEGCLRTLVQIEKQGLLFSGKMSVATK